MREHSIIKYEDSGSEFIELIYFNGPKIMIGKSKPYILVWHDDLDTAELWFLIKCKQELFEDYIANKITLLDVMQVSNTELVERSFENYDDLITYDVNIMDHIDSSILPGNNSYLGFDYRKETLEQEIEKYIVKDLRHIFKITQNSFSNSFNVELKAANMTDYKVKKTYAYN